jgi:hypothetical protein
MCDGQEAKAHSAQSEAFGRMLQPTETMSSSRQP